MATIFSLLQTVVVLSLLPGDATTASSSRITASPVLRVTGFRVPVLAVYGTDVELDCPFTAASTRTKLYSVKWYHNSDEFYRYIFADATPIFTFPLPGIQVDLNRSNSSRVVLKSVNFDTSATFRCEVSADAPDFQTVQRRANLTVFQVSEDGPNISGLRDRYETDDLLDVNCSAPSGIEPTDITRRHPTLLTLWINDGLVESRRIEMSSPVSWSSTTTSTIRLRLNLTDRNHPLRQLVGDGHFFRLNCSLSIGRSHQQEGHVLFSRSLELKAALMPSSRRPFHSDARLNRNFDLRSTATFYSSSSAGGGGTHDRYRLKLVALLTTAVFIVNLPFMVTNSFFCRA